jgi:hypothetical protein
VVRGVCLVVLALVHTLGPSLHYHHSAHVAAESADVSSGVEDTECSPHPSGAECAMCSLGAASAMFVIGVSGSILEALPAEPLWLDSPTVPRTHLAVPTLRGPPPTCATA